MRQTKIYVLSLTLLKNDKHMAITAFMAEALKKFSIAETSLAIFVAAYLAAYDKENKAFKRIDRKALTKAMNDADLDRISALRVLRDILKTFIYRKNEEKKALADRMLDIIEEYGGVIIYTQPIDSRTANISNLIEDIEEYMPDAITTLGVTEEFQTLKTANELFLQYQIYRVESDAAHGKKAMADARVETDNAWRAVVDSANNTIAYGPEEEVEVLVPFAKYINVEIDKYRIQNGQGVGGGSGSSSNRPSDGEGEGGGTESTPTMKNATFKKADGTSVVIPFEVGTVIVYPDNTVGYKWSPNLEFMPKTNKTFKEVPIVDRETIALFHFADHTEEEIKQYVGTLLHAPDNTTGCYWDPAVPELMPAEDTQYYELPIENDDNQGGGNNSGGSTGGDQGGGSTGGGGNNGGYPPGYDPDADLDPGV